MRISLQETVGKNYADFWQTKKRYRVCKGSRGSKKSKTAMEKWNEDFTEILETAGKGVD